MKKHDDSLNKLETVTTIIVNIGTIVSWIFTIATAFALLSQPEPISLMGSFELGKPYIITFLVSIFFGYIQLLRHFWRGSRITKMEVERSFGSYLYGSIIKFKRPYVSIGFAVIFIIMYQVEPTGFASFAGICIAATVFVGFVITMADDSSGGVKKIFWQLDDETNKRWLKRVRNQLHENGYVFTSDFNNLGVDSDEINWAIENYFNQYEFEQGLVLTKRTYRETFENKIFIELRFKHLPTRLKKG